MSYIRRPVVFSLLLVALALIPLSAAAQAQVDATITLQDFTFVGLPEQLPAGTYTWEVVNQGPQPHELVLVKLLPGKTVDEVLPLLQQPGPPPDPPPVELPPAGVVEPMAAGQSATLTVTLAPGTYLAVCFVPDPATNLPHTALGMVDVVGVVTVTGALPDTGAEQGSVVLLLAAAVVLLLGAMLVRRRLVQ